MKISIISIALVISFIGCKSQSSTSIPSYVDSSIIAFPTPDKLSKTDIENYQNALNEIFEKELLRYNFNGSILVAKEGNILYEKYVGFTNPRTQNMPISDSTSFHLASTSKPFTGVAILHLIQQGKINLNDNISRFFPKFPYLNVTIKDLLCHRSGLPNYLYFMEDKAKWPIGKMINNQDVLDFMIQYKPAVSYKTGTRFNYCNTNYVLLALIIEKITGTSYPKYMHEYVFKPLQMTHTFVYTPADSGKVIMSYKPSGELWAYDMFDNTYGDKNIYSTPRDMFRWDVGLYSNQFIRQTLLDSAFHPQSNETASTHNYGLGWRMLNLPNGKQVVYHNGKWHGFTPAFARLRDEKGVIIILGNQYNKNIYKAAKRVYNVFGDYMQNQSAEEDDAITLAPAAMSTPITTPTPTPVIQHTLGKKQITKTAPLKKIAPSKKAPSPKEASHKKTTKPEVAKIVKPIPKKSATAVDSKKKNITKNTKQQVPNNSKKNTEPKKKK